MRRGPEQNRFRRGSAQAMKPTPVQLREWLLPILSWLAPTFEGDIVDDTSLGDEGCFDSITLVDLVAEIERGLGIRIRDDQVSQANFGTVGRLLMFLGGARMTGHP